MIQGNAAFRNGKFEEAVTCYTECMKADPSESTYPLNRSMAYLKMRKYAGCSCHLWLLLYTLSFGAENPETEG